MHGGKKLCNAFELLLNFFFFIRIRTYEEALEEPRFDPRYQTYKNSFS